MSSGRARAWLGIDLGATKTLIVCVDAAGRLVRSTRIESLRDDGPRPLLDRIAVAARSMPGDDFDVSGAGVGFAGLVDPAAGIVRSTIMLPGWDGLSLAEELEARLSVPVRVDNDATAAGIGEYHVRGAPAGMTMVLLTIGTGIGGALILNGELFRGATGLAAEFGNMSIDWRGETCWCGAYGCLNMLASGSAIEARYQALSGRFDRPGVAKIATAAAGGDPDATRAIEDAARSLGAGVANLINIFNPDVVVLAGGVTRLGEDYLSMVRAEAGARAFREAFDHARIEPAMGGYEVGALGAAYLVRDALEREASP